MKRMIYVLGIVLLLAGCGGDTQNIGNLEDGNALTVKVLDSETSQPVSFAPFSIYYIEVIIEIPESGQISVEGQSTTVIDGITNNGGTLEISIDPSLLPEDSELLQVLDPLNQANESGVGNVLGEIIASLSWGYFMIADAAGYSDNTIKLRKEDLSNKFINIHIDPI